MEMGKEGAEKIKSDVVFVAQEVCQSGGMKRENKFCSEGMHLSLALRSR
jgi:hypothetical protein